MSKGQKSKVIQKNSRRHFVFSEMPIWKALLTNSLPMVVMMLIFGIYSFVDSILAVQLAPKAYHDIPTAQILGLKNYVRLANSSSMPIIFLITSISLLFGVGISTRVSINLGQKRTDRAINTLKTGFQIQMLLSFVLMVVLLFIATPWMEAQYPPSKFGTVVRDGYKYIAIIIGAIPLSFFNQTIAGIFRLEVRIKEMMIASISPIFINLLLDWVFMGPGKMGIEGGAWATFISYGITTLLLIVFSFKNKTKLLKWRNFFGKFHIISIIGILFVGISPFLRNFANSITQTTQLSVVQDVSSHIFRDKAKIDINNIMNLYMNHRTNQNEQFRLINGAVQMFKKQQGQDISIINDYSLWNKETYNLLVAKPSLQVKIKSILTQQYSGSFLSIASSGVFPIFGLFFPSIFGFVQGGGPIAAYNYGAKNFLRVKSIFKWTIIYGLATGIILYLLGAVILSKPLLNVLGVSKDYIEYSQTTLYILMASVPLFAIGIAGLVVLTATDHIVASIIGSSARGFIFFFPVTYIFRSLAITHNGTWYLFWFGGPLITCLSSILIITMAIYTLKRLHLKTMTLDDRIQKIYIWVENYSKSRKIKKMVKKNQK